MKNIFSKLGSLCLFTMNWTLNHSCVYPSEYLDDVSIDAFNKYSNYNMNVSQTLFMEFHGPAIGLEDQFNTVSKSACI